VIPRSSLRLVRFAGFLLAAISSVAQPAVAQQSSFHAAASYVGEVTEDHAGLTVAGAGDADGDGYYDLLIAAPQNNEVGHNAGQVYLVLGSPSSWSLGTDLAASDASFLGEALDDQAGTALSGGGDVNGDGYDDFLIGVHNNDEGGDTAGQAYLVLGRATGWAMDTPLGTVDASFVGTPDDEVGVAVAIDGDVNGDGYEDLLIGAPGSAYVGDTRGRAYLVLGGPTGWTMDAPLAGRADVWFAGEAHNDGAGAALALVGDVDGDGNDDVLVAAQGNDQAGTTAGKIYLVLGQGGGLSDITLDLADASFLGEGAMEGAGDAVGGAGDVNGDGYDDLLIACAASAVMAPMAGQVYLVLGRASGWAQDVSLGTVDASFLGEAAYDMAGADVSAAGDVDGDGLDDLLFSAPQHDGLGHDLGRVYLFRGRTSGWTFLMASADADAVFDGVGIEEQMGWAAVGVGDVNGDGLDDLLAGADQNDALGNHTGKAYLAFGASEADVDGDGWSFWDGDCDDGDPAVFPGAVEVADGIDEDCDGVVDEETEAFDDDGDGFTELEGDCDDGDPSQNPGAEELCNGLDDDCDGVPGHDEVDSDEDGYLACDDCDDENDQAHPGGSEVCDDGVDGDCLDDLQETEVDDDGDGTSECAGDCDDGNPNVHPLADEVCNGGIDDDCDPDTDELADVDGDQYTLCDGDCDDHYAFSNPAMMEICDTRDNDCDGVVDEEVDYDLDGFFACGGPDCDDHAPGTHPGATETPYDGVDQDCDGVDLADLDGDGVDGGAYGEDCNDLDPTTHPGADEVCHDGVDNDCDNAIDTGDADCQQPVGSDSDGCACSGGVGTSRGTPWSTATLVVILAVVAWCRRRRLARTSSVILACMALLTGGCSEELAELPCTPHEWYHDADGDGYGLEHLSLAACSRPEGHVPLAGDCDDTDPGRSPGAEEQCDGLDNDCDGAIDEGHERRTWYADTDGDGHGDTFAVHIGCSQPLGYVTSNTDCNDDDPAVFPGALEQLCDGVDSDCDGRGDAVTAVLDGEEHATIQQAVNVSIDGETVFVCPGTHHQQIRIPDDRVLTLTSWSGSSEDTVLDGHWKWTILHIGCFAEVELSSLSFVRGEGDHALVDGGGGAVWSGASSLRISNCYFGETHAEHWGGAVLVHTNEESCGAYDTVSLIVQECLFDANSSFQGGAIRVNTGVQSELVIESTSFSRNDVANAMGRGAAIYIGGAPSHAETHPYSVSVSNSTFTENTGDQAGAIDLHNGGSIEASFHDTTFSDNESDDSAGIVIDSYESFDLYLEDCLFSENTAVWGDSAAIYLYGDHMEDSESARLNAQLTDVVIDGNSSYHQGTALEMHGGPVDSTLTLIDCSITRNQGDAYMGAGAVHLVNSHATLISESTDWGEGATDNTPWDLTMLCQDATYTWLNFDGAASFTCSGDGDCCQ